MELVQKVKETQLQPTRGRRQGLFLLAAPVGMQLQELPNPGAASSSDFPSRTVFLVAFTPPVGNMKFQVI